MGYCFRLIIRTSAIGSDIIRNRLLYMAELQLCVWRCYPFPLSLSQLGCGVIQQDLVAFLYINLRPTVVST